MDPILLSLSPLVLGYGMDLLLGDPAWLPHPVVVFGWAIARTERLLNRGSARFWKGLAVATTLITGVFLVTRELEWMAGQVSPLVRLIVDTVGVFYGLANRTLIAEGRAVFAALEHGVDAGRRRLSRIVGRDTASLDAQQVKTAVFETMSENLSDGVVAPLFFYALLGVPGMMAYKMVNTLDSMIGHKDERFIDFGKAAARIDDVANFIPARLTALLMVTLTASRRGLYFILRYGRAHDSPNSGYPEAALAGILDVRFGGPHRYDGEIVDKPWIGEHERIIEASEIRRVAGINHAVCAATIGLILLLTYAHERGEDGQRISSSQTVAVANATAGGPP